MAKLIIADIRQEYTKGGLRENELPGDPLSLFNRWLQEAIDAEVDEPTAVIVGTVSPERRPSTRTVLLKGLHDGKFVFYTNYESRKGRQLAQNPYISLSFVWHALERQIHIEGIATKVPPEESDEYFRKRPYKSRVGARISPQSQPITSRMQLIRSFVREAARRSEAHIPHVRLERPHVGINRAAGTVHRRVVILVAIARVQKLCAGQIRQRDGTVEGPAGVAVRPV